jgi:iron complex transport system ATP-binding protein
MNRLSVVQHGGLKRRARLGTRCRAANASARIIARALAQRPQHPAAGRADQPPRHPPPAIDPAARGIELPVTTVIALHDLNQALACDRVGVMHKGRLAVLGRPRDVLTAELLLDVFGVRASFLTDPADGARIIRFHTTP